MKVRRFSVYSHAILLLFVFLVTGGVVIAQDEIEVEMENGYINLIAENMTFGEVLDLLSRKGNFTVKMPPEERSKKISIRMYQTDLDRAVNRLFTLGRIENFMVEYRSTNKIKHIEVIEDKRKGGPLGRSAEGPRIVSRNRLTPQRRSQTVTRRSQKASPQPKRTRRYRSQYVVPRQPGTEPSEKALEPDTETPGGAGVGSQEFGE